MKVQVIDQLAFNAIEPQIARRYLNHNGWTHQHTLPSDVSIWANETVGGSGARIWFPDRASLPDYSSIVQRALRTIAEAEDRSELSLIEDLQTVAVGDVVRLTTEDPLDRGANTLLYHDCISLYEQGFAIKVSAAMSQNKTREVHPSARARDVQEFARKMRAGQTEPGSYTIKLISPITDDDLEAKPESVNQAQALDAPQLPFSRLAINKLVSSLDRLHDIADEASKKGKYYFDPFVQAVPVGVSANLCDAVANTRGQKDRPLEVTVTWSYAVSNKSFRESVYQVDFEPNQLQFFRQAATEFRKRNPIQRAVSGYVRVLSSDKGSDSGTISLITSIRGSTRVVKMELEGERYKRAINAHEKELEFAASGTLDLRGRTYWLRDIEDAYVTRQTEMGFDESPDDG